MKPVNSMSEKGIVLSHIALTALIPTEFGSVRQS